MKKYISFFITGAFLAATPVFAFEAVANSQDTVVSSDGGSFQESQNQEVDALRHRRGRDHRNPRYCPPDYERQPNFRWDRSRRRWVRDGWICRPRVEAGVDLGADLGDVQP